MMKKMLLPILALVFSACTPLVTVTPEATVTLTPPPTQTPIPTPTLHPDFVALQDYVAASGERFTLNPADGTVSDADGVVPGLHANSDGTWTIKVNGKDVILESNQVSFDDEKGVLADGFENEDGEWVEAEIPETGSSSEQVARIAELNSEWNGVLTIDPETGEITSKVGEGAPVEGMKYNPETGKIDLTFWSDGLGRDFTQQIDPSFINFGRYDGEPVNVKNIVKALTIGEDGQIERVFAKDDGGETSVPLRTPAELYQMKLEDSSADPHWREESLKIAEELYNLARDKGIIEVGNGGWNYIRYKDLYAKIYSGNYWGSNNAIVWNEETQKFEEHEVATDRIAALDNYPDRSVAFVFWMGKNGLRMELVVGPTNINRMFVQYGKQCDDVLGAYGYAE